MNPPKNENNTNENDREKIYMNAMEALIELYSFNKGLENLLKDNTHKVFERKYYLINENFFSEYRKLYSYEDIYKDLLRINISSIQREKLVKTLYEKNKNSFINNYKVKNLQIPFLLNDNKYLIFDYKKNYQAQENILVDKYSFINEKILEKIISPNFNKNEIFINECYINNKKFILKCNKKTIIIGEINWNNFSNIFLLEMILEYNNGSFIDEQFLQFKNAYINDIKAFLNLKGEIMNSLRKIGTNDILGRAYFINSKKSNNINDDYIKILLYIYLNNEYIKYNTSKNIKNNQQFEVCYIVNKNYINNLKELLHFDEFCYHIKEIFDKYKSIVNHFNELLNNNQFLDEVKNNLSKSQFFANINAIIDKHKFNEIKNDYQIININKINLKDNNQLYYYKDFEIISNNLYQILEELHLTLNDEYMIKTKCLFCDNKIIFYPYDSCLNYLIIGNINNINEFNTELVFYYDNSLYLDSHIKEILKNGYAKIFSYLLFEKNTAKIYNDFSHTHIGTAYKIEEEKLSNEMIEEIYIIIKIYLFNLDLQKNFNSSMDHAGSDNYKNYIKADKCYLINKEWMDEYKKYYLYDELYNYLEKDEIKKKIEIHHYNGKSYNESATNIEAIFNEIKNNADFFKKYYNKSPKSIDSTLLDTKPINSGNKNNKNEFIFYYDNFVMIDMELKRAIIIKKYKKSIGNVEYIINMGKIIILLNNHPMNLLLIGSINITKGECNFIATAFIYFDDANELQKNYNILKSCDYNSFIKQLKKDKNKIFDKNHLREVGSFYSLQNEEEIKENNDKKKDNIIKYIVELYLAIDNFYFHIKDKSKALISQENYYLINKVWLEYLNKCYNFDQINNVIKNNSAISKIIEKNRELLEKTSEANIINSIINQIPQEIKNDINNKEKHFDKFLIVPFDKKINNEDIYYYDDCILINEKTKNILVNINNINEQFNVDVNCFIDSKHIFILYRLKEKPLICIGKLDENNILKNNIIITLDSNDTYENYIHKIIAKGDIHELLNKIKQENKKEKFYINSIGWVFLLDNLNKEKNNPVKNISGQNIKDIGEENIGQLTIPVGVNSNIIKNDINEINITPNQDNNLGQNINGISDNNSIGNDANENEKIKLLLKEQMKPIINYYLFNSRFINELELSKSDKNGIFYNNFKHYLISSKSISVFKTHYLINALFSFFRSKFGNNLNNILNNGSAEQIIKELISENILAELSKNIIFKNLINNLKTELKIEENNFNFEYDIINNKYYLKNFDIVDENFYREIIIKKNMNYKNKIFATDIIINNGKIVVDLKEYVLIGHLKDITTYNYSFVSDALLIDYKNKNNNMIIGSLKQMSYINFLKNESLINTIFIRYFDESLRPNQINQGQNNNNMNYPEFNDDKTLNSGKDIIKMFIVLFLHYKQMNEDINKEIKFNSNKTYFLINKEFLKIYKEYYNYQHINNILENIPNIKSILCNYEQNIPNIIHQFDNKFIYELGKKRENQASIIPYLSKEKGVISYIKNTQNGNPLEYYEDCEIINNDFIKSMGENENHEINKLIPKMEINCLFGEKKIFIYLHDQHFIYHYLDIGHLEQNIFMTDFIIYFHNKSLLDKYISIIKAESFEKNIKPHLADIQQKIFLKS